jgi:hypothetical protein
LTCNAEVAVKVGRREEMRRKPVRNIGITLAALVTLALSLVVAPRASAAACCFDDMSCADMSRQDCFEEGGWPHDAGSSCASVECYGPVTVACCMPDGSCVELQPRTCSRDGGQPHYAQGSCDVVGCGEGCGRVAEDLLWGGIPLRVEKAEAGTITLTWSASCLVTDQDYAVYEGTLGNFYNHEDRFCTTNGDLRKTFMPREDSAYYLIVPRDSGKEGSYGVDDIGFERPQGVSSCFQQLIGVCE